MIKPKMATNERDKNLLMILALILVAFIAYYFVISPALTSKELLKADAEAAKAEYNRVSEIVQKLPELRKEEVEQKEALSEKYRKFFYEINEERILVKLNELIAGAALPVNSVTISKPAADSIKVEQPEYTPLAYPLMELASKTNAAIAIEKATGVEKEKKSKELPPDAVAYSDFVIGFVGVPYESVDAFMKAVETMDRSVIVKSITIADARDAAGVSGQLVLGVYSLAKPNEAENIELQFNPAYIKGKANPFS